MQEYSILKDNLVISSTPNFFINFDTYHPLNSDLDQATKMLCSHESSQVHINQNIKGYKT